MHEPREIRLPKETWREIADTLYDVGAREHAKLIRGEVEPLLPPTEPDPERALTLKVRDRADDIWARIPALGPGWVCISQMRDDDYEPVPWAQVWADGGPLRNAT